MLLAHTIASLLIAVPAFIACAQDGNHCGQVRAGGGGRGMDPTAASLRPAPLVSGVTGIEPASPARPGGRGPSWVTTCLVGKRPLGARQGWTAPYGNVRTAIVASGVDVEPEDRRRRACSPAHDRPGKDKAQRGCLPHHLGHQGRALSASSWTAQRGPRSWHLRVRAVAMVVVVVVLSLGACQRASEDALLIGRLYGDASVGCVWIGDPNGP
jgi:hypothetical protein